MEYDPEAAGSSELPLLSSRYNITSIYRNIHASGKSRLFLGNFLPIEDSLLARNFKRILASGGATVVDAAYISGDARVMVGCMMNNVLGEEEQDEFFPFLLHTIFGPGSTIASGI